MTNPFDAFDTQTVERPAAAPASNPFDQFDAPGSYSGGAGYFPQAAKKGPIAFPEGGGQMPDGSVTNDPKVWAEWTKAQPAVNTGPLHLNNGPPTTPTTPSANRTAAVQEGIAGLGNMLTDPVGNLIGKPVATVGVALHDYLAPKFGGQQFTPAQRNFLLSDQVEQPGTKLVDAASNSLGIPQPGDVPPAGPGQALERSAIAGGIGMAPFGVTGGIGGVVKNTLLGAFGGGAGEIASTIASDPYKEVAALGGNAAAVPIAGTVVGQTAGRLVGNREAYRGRPETVTDARGNAVVDYAGKRISLLDGSPLKATPDQQRLAADSLAANMDTPPGEAAAKIDAYVPAIQGDAPTSPQLLEDQRLAGLERGVARQPGNSPAFLARETQQNEAQVAEASKLGAGSDPSQLTTGLKGQAAFQDAGQDQNVALQQGKADQALADTGGQFSGMDAAGAALRDPVEGNRAGVKQATGAALDAFDPEGKLNLEQGGVRKHALGAEKARPANEKPPSGEEAAITDIAKNLPDVGQFRELNALRGRTLAEIRALKNQGQGETVPVHRLNGILNSIHETMGLTVENSGDSPGQKLLDAWRKEASAAAAEGGKPAPQVGGEVFRKDGSRVSVDYELVDPGSLITSHDKDFNVNPAYDQNLQQRGRDKITSQRQVDRIATAPIPEKLGASVSLGDGAPIVGPDHQVESGNARVLGLQRIMRENGPQAEMYREWLRSQGHDIGPNDNRIMIRRRTTDMTPEERIGFAKEANLPDTMPLSAAERAKGDAALMDNKLMDQYDPSAGITDQKNIAFVRSFGKNVSGTGDENTFVARDGSISQDGEKRIQTALVHKAYGSGALTESLSESTDPVAKVLADSMQDAAGSMARMRSQIDAGLIPKDMDMAPALLEAVDVVQRARSKGISLLDAVNQLDMHTKLSPKAEMLLKAAYGEKLAGRMSGEAMADLLRFVAEKAEEQGKTTDMISGNLSAEQLVAQASERYGKDSRRASGDAGVSGLPGARNAQGGSEVRGPVSGAGGQEAPAGSGQAGERTDILPEKALVPNWTEADRQQINEANSDYRDYKNTFRNAPGIGTILRRDGTGHFKSPDSSVPDLLIKPGPGGKDLGIAYIKAGGDPEAMVHAFAYMLRRAAVGDDGTINVKVYDRMLKQYDDFLSVMPGADKFSTAVKAQKTVDAAMALRAETIKAREHSAVGRLLGNSDPVREVGSMLEGKTGVADITKLMDETANDAAARGGLKAAAREYVFRRYQSVTKGVASDQGTMRSVPFRKFLRDSDAALRVLFSPEEMQALENVAESMNRQTATGRGSAVGTGTTTAQDEAAMGKNASVWDSWRRYGIGAVARTASGAGSGYLAEGIGWAFGMPGIGTAAGAVLGGIINHIQQAAREAGMKTVDDLKAAAILNPQLMSVLMTKVTPGNRVAVANALLKHLSRMSIIHSTGPDQDQRKPAPAMAPSAPRNTLLH